MPRLAHCCLIALGLSACAGPGGLALEPLEDRVGFVGSALVVPVEARGTAAPIRFGFETDAPDVCRAGRCRAGFDEVEPGRALLRWVPRESDVGRWTFAVFATDGTTRATSRFEVEVRSSVGYAGLPRFVQPLGTGTTLEFGRRRCFELDVVVDDPDSRGVSISMVPPLLAGAELDERGAFTASFEWCPTPAQLRSGDHRRVLFAADDGDNPVTHKELLLVMRRDAKPDCDGAPPALEIVTAELGAGSDVVLTARAVAEDGLKHAPLVYYSTVRPAADPDLSRMTQLELELAEGDRFDGTWTVTIPNPVGELPDGASVPLHYLVSATANADDGAPCDFHAQAPATGSATIAVRAPDPSHVAAVGPCAPCSSDAACETGARCVGMGTRGLTFCLSSCDDGTSCEGGGRCSDEPVRTLSGESVHACIPEGGSCETDPDGCGGDRFEPNDSFDLAREAEPLPSGVHDGLSLCRLGDDRDEDWYRIEVEREARLLADLRGGSRTDLDLALADDSGTVRELAESIRSEEAIAACVEPGTHYLRVFGWGEGPNDYRLNVDARPTTCEAGCEPDRAEDDDDARHARRVTLSPEYVSTGNTICAGDDDWYAVRLEAGQTMAVELSFVQTAPTEDLDLHFYDSRMEDWTPCSEADPSRCSAFQGQSIDSNEYYDVTVEEAGTYFLVVHGFDGSENDYDIRLWLLELGS
jgi:hypothetical protein